MARKASRIRWLTKIRVLRRYGVSFSADPRACLQYVVIDPELDNFSYSLTNNDELAAAVARALGDTSVDAVVALFDEINGDREVASELRSRRRWRPDAKQDTGYGRRIAWYALARLLKPSLVVETGIKDGLGSVLLLRALERNAAEGFDGRLLSFDLSPDRGWLVSPRFRPGWEPVFAPTQVALEPSLRGRRVGLIIHDSEPTYERAAHEFSVALDHAGDCLGMVSNGDWSEALRDICQQTGARYETLREKPDHAFYPGSRVDIGVLDRRDCSRASGTEVGDGGS
jgi:hypothetical protein